MILVSFRVSKLGCFEYFVVLFFELVKVLVKARLRVTKILSEGPRNATVSVLRRNQRDGLVPGLLRRFAALTFLVHS